MKSTKKMVYISLLVSQALVLYIIESMLPVPFIAPGAKLGLPNLITVIGLYTLSYSETFLIIILRVILSTLFAGTLTSFLYSISGAILSFFIMCLVKKIGSHRVSIIGVSAAGAVFHNVGQILVAALVIQNINIALYLPILNITGIVTGIFIGITANYAITYVKRIPYLNNTK
ncbi:MAG: hypothetical protein K0R54_408 [Clostridiaceae bacterium]|jgi:heptaprenyl diphosphate synthase|nr:hypothetical protein [Clostridiaceae bacterium]